MRKITAIAILAAGLAVAASFFGMATGALAGPKEDADAAWQAFVRDDFGRAIALYSRAIDSGTLSPRAMPDAMYNRGRAYQAIGDNDRAIADYGRIIKLNPYFPQVFLARGDAWLAQGRPARAIADFGQAIEIKPDATEGYLRRARVHADQGAWDKALADHGRIIALMPDDALAYAERCGLYEKIGRREAAIADCRRALEIDPGNVGASQTLERLGETP